MSQFMSPTDVVTERYIVQRRRNETAEWQYVDEWDDVDAARACRDEWLDVGEARIVFEVKQVITERTVVP